ASLRTFDVAPACHERAWRLAVRSRQASRMVRKRGFEPLRYYYRQPLKLVRLPVPPLPRGERTVSIFQANLTEQATRSDRTDSRKPRVNESHDRYRTCWCCGGTKLTVTFVLIGTG